MMASLAKSHEQVSLTPESVHLSMSGVHLREPRLSPSATELTPPPTGSVRFHMIPGQHGSFHTALTIQSNRDLF